MEDRVGPWPEPCTCTPGSAENGWHEQRSPECKAHERKIWKDFFEVKVPAVLAWARKRRDEGKS